MTTERFYIADPSVPLAAFVSSQILLITVYVKKWTFF